MIKLRSQIIACAGLLLSVGLIIIYASSGISAAEKFGDPFFFLQKQAAAGVLGFLIIFALGHISDRMYPRLTLPLLGLSLLLLVAVIASPWSSQAGGATRWIRVFGVSFQPAELAKLAFVMFLAKNLSRPRINLSRWSWIAPNLLILAVFAVLLLWQPDFGTLALMTAVAFGMLFVAGVSLPKVALLGAIGLSGIIAAVATSPYRLRRITAFLDPWAEAQGSGFQIIQSLIGYQNGGVFGLGLGESKQKLYFLPEAHNDFIMSVIGEELGLFGVALVCSLFAYLALLGFEIARRQRHAYYQLLAVGLTLMITGQALINMGVSMGVLPTKGTTLPMVSSGANSLLVYLIAIAILARLAQNTGPQSQTGATSLAKA